MVSARNLVLKCIFLYLAVGSIAKPYGGEFKLSFKDKMQQFLKRFESKASCVACKTFTDIAQIAFKTKPTQDKIASFLTKLCIKLNIESTRVCTGIIKEFQEEVLTVVDDYFLSSDEVCGSLLGPSCATKPNPDFFWNVTFPKTPKPPVRPIPAPKAGSPVTRVLHLSDIHLDPHYQEGAVENCGEPLCCRKTDKKAEPGKGAGKYGSYACDTPLITLENMLQHINENHEIDYVLWTGDIPAHNVWNQTRHDQLEALDHAVNLILKYLPNKVIFPALGNHESAPVNSFPPPSITGSDSNQWLRDSLSSHWKHWLPESTMPTIKKGAYYTVLNSQGIRIVTLNMNYCNNQNWWLLLNDVDPAHQLQWLVNTLQQAEDNGVKVHIVGHIPPGSSDCLKAWSWNYYSIINRYQSTVTAQFFGHTHNDEFELFYDEKTSTIPISIAYLGPSVTPYQAHNPGYRIYTIDGDYVNSSRVVLNHETYILDLTKANQGNVTWELEYSAKEAYKMSSLLPSEWDALIDRMATDKDLLDLFYKHFWKSAPYSEHGGPCTTESCRHNLMCRMLHGRSYDTHVCSLKNLNVNMKEKFNAFIDLC